MTSNQNSREIETHGSAVIAGEVSKSTDGLISEEIFRWLLFTLLPSAVSSILAIFVAMITRRESKTLDKEKEQDEKNIKVELQELHKEIALLKGNGGS